MATLSLAAEVDESGYALAQNAVQDALLRELLEAIDEIIERDTPSANHGLRGLLARSARCRELAASPRLQNLAQAVLGSSASVVKGIYFDKNPAANWLVPWHQDITITVRERLEVPGFGPWSVKDRLVHVQPPAQIMENILALRIHLDDTGPDNGALRVLPATHLRGRISASEIPELAKKATPVICSAKRGDVLLMRPLLLHSSPPSVIPSHRRVIHLEYAAMNLPGGLEWMG